MPVLVQFVNLVFVYANTKSPVQFMPFHPIKDQNYFFWRVLYNTCVRV